MAEDGRRGLPSLPVRRGGGPAGSGGKSAWVALAAAAPALAAAAWGWAVHKASAPPEVFVGQGALRDRVLPWLTHLTKPFVPAPLALNTHVQNVLGFIRGAHINPRYTRQLIIAHDGGTLGLDWFAGCDSPRYAAPGTPVLLVLHGINGGSHEGYCKWVCHEACAKGWRATVLNYRGCGGLPLTSPRGYAASLTHDIHFTITTIKARFPQAPIFAVGFSLGGVFLTKYLAEADNGLHVSDAASRQPATHTPHVPRASPHQPAGPAQPLQNAPDAPPSQDGGAAPAPEVDETSSALWEPWFQRGSGLVAAAVVSSPVCLFNSSAQLSQPFTINYLYNLALAYKLREFIRHHEREIRGKHTSLDLEGALNKWTVPAMEDQGIPKTFGFQNRAEYYEAVSSLGYIPRIKTPTLFLVAKDDPFLGVLPDKECAENPNTLLAATERGGHVAFLQGLWPLGPAFMDHAVLQFLEAAWQHLPPPSHRAAPAQPAYHPPSTLHPHHAHLRQQQQQQQQQEAEQGAGGEGVQAPRVWLQPEVWQASSGYEGQAGTDGGRGAVVGEQQEEGVTPSGIPQKSDEGAAESAAAAAAAAAPSAQAASCAAPPDVSPGTQDPQPQPQLEREHTRALLYHFSPFCRSKL